MYRLSCGCGQGGFLLEVPGENLFLPPPASRSRLGSQPGHGVMLPSPLPAPSPSLFMRIPSRPRAHQENPRPSPVPRSRLQTPFCHRMRPSRVSGHQTGSSLGLRPPLGPGTQSRQACASVDYSPRTCGGDAVPAFTAQNRGSGRLISWPKVTTRRAAGPGLRSSSVRLQGSPHLPLTLPPKILQKPTAPGPCRNQFCPARPSPTRLLDRAQPRVDPGLGGLAGSGFAEGDLRGSSQAASLATCLKGTRVLFKSNMA